MFKGSSLPNSTAHVSFKRDLRIEEKRRIKERYNRDLKGDLLQDIQGLILAQLHITCEFQQRPMEIQKETCKRDVLKRPRKETYKRDLLQDSNTNRDV